MGLFPDRVRLVGVDDVFWLAAQVAKAYLVAMRRPVLAAWMSFLAALVTIFAGCAPSLTPTVKGMRQAWSPLKVAVYVPVSVRSGDNGSEILGDAPLVVREAIEKELKLRGCSVVVDSSLDQLVASTAASSDLTFGTAAETAAKVGADIALVGRLYDYRRGWLFGKSSLVDLRVDVVAVDGAGLGGVRYRETAAQEDPAELARDVSAKIARSIDSSWGGCGKSMMDSTGM
jgi:hypothetical protein